MYMRNFLGKEIFPLGFGCMRFPKTDDKVDVKETEKILKYAIDEGLTYLDTAYFYHEYKSEEILGDFLSNGYRDKVFLTTKSPLSMIKEEGDFERIFKEQMKKLKTDHFDLYMFHAVSDERWENTVKKFDLLSKMRKLKADGLVKNIGFSFHDNLSAFKKIIDEFPDCDACQIQLNYIDVNHQAGIEGLRYAAQRGIEVIIMEPLLGGKLANVTEDVISMLPNGKSPVQNALDFLWNMKEVSLILSGMSNMTQVKENLSFAKDSYIGKLSCDDLKAFENAKRAYDSHRPVSCTACRYCMPCPCGVDIPAVFDFCNRNSDETYFNALENYKKEKITAEKCTNCGICLEKCPQKLPINSLMKEIKETYI